MIKYDKKRLRNLEAKLAAFILFFMGMMLVSVPLPKAAELGDRRIEQAGSLFGENAILREIRKRVSDRLAEQRTVSLRFSQKLTDAEATTITVGGLKRKVFMVAPPSGRASSAVIVFHGGGGTSKTMAKNNSLSHWATKIGFVAVFPQAFNKNWNDGRVAVTEEPDDVAFTKAIINVLHKNFGVDKARVFATGISNGAMMTYKLACDAPGIVRAIAPVAGNIPESQMTKCGALPGTPLMMFSGTDDPLMPYDGGVIGEDSHTLIRHIANPADDQIASAPETASFWAEINRCRRVIETRLDDIADDGTSVVQLEYVCPPSGQTILYRIEGGGHTWPGSKAQAPRISGKTSQDIDASQTMLKFFQKYGL